MTAGGRASRDKGNRAERETVRLLRAVGFSAEKVSRTGYTGSDVSIRLLGRDRRAEVKIRHGGFKQLYDWLTTADLLIVRADRSEPLIITPFRLAVSIARAAEGKNVPAYPAKSRTERLIMSTDNDKPKTENLPVPADDGFDDIDTSNDRRLIQGQRAVCIDGIWSIDGVEIPPDKKDTRYLAISTLEAVQRWQGGVLLEQIVKQPGGKPLPDVDELNKTIPEQYWDDGKNGKRPPYVHQYVLYFVDPATGEIFTSINSTFGQAKAVNQLKNRIKWQRIATGIKVTAIFTLGKQTVSKRYHKIGPVFIVVGWRDLNPALPEQVALPAPSSPSEDDTAEKTAAKKDLNDPLDDIGIGRPVTMPSLGEMLKDELPGDCQPPKEATAPKAAAAAQKPQMTKRGAQKIASGRS